MSASNIIGYADPLIAYPGTETAVKVSSSRSTFTSQVLRLLAGFDHPNAPPVSHQLVESIPKQSYNGKLQFSRIGSYARVDSWRWSDLDEADSLSVSFWCQATLPEEAKHDQYLFSSIQFETATGFECLLDEAGSLRFRIGSFTGLQEVQLTTRLTRHQWYYLRFTLNIPACELTLEALAKSRDIGESSISVREKHVFNQTLQISSHKPFVIASDSNVRRVYRQPEKSSSFNGKIEAFMVEKVSRGSIETILNFDFSLDISTDRVRGTGNSCEGVLINAPTRAVTGHDWDASQNNWSSASYGYGAIHFHDDDLDDAAWETSFTLKLPPDLRSGCYGVLVSDGESEEIVPFFVRPDPNAHIVPPVALIIPTFTYNAYANERLHDASRKVHFGEVQSTDKYFHILEDRPDLGISLYDSHTDGSGTCHSTMKRPVLNMRPDYCMWLFGGPREFPADLWLVDFLERQLGPNGYDIITDHDISEFGAPLLNKYRVLISCSHPEYPTFHMLDSYQAFLGNGGYFMYLGGNGYYWVTTHDPARPHRIEVRRADQGCRTFGLPPGNWHHSLTGELGGLWRGRGRPPNQLFGLGSCAMGVAKGVGYGISEDARSDPRMSFVFSGLEADSIIGDYGLVQGAASGDEIDRLDYSLGTPRNAVILATTKLAGGHSDEYLLFNEETLFPMLNTTGTTSDKIRSDMIYFETASHGAVFSVGSINWVGALAWNAFENNVAKVTANVLQEFIRRQSSSKS